jgi:hypothetical protein
VQDADGAQGVLGTRVFAKAECLKLPSCSLQVKKGK